MRASNVEIAGDISRYLKTACILFPRRTACQTRLRRKGPSPFQHRSIHRQYLAPEREYPALASLQQVVNNFCLVDRFPANPSSGPKVNEKNLIETARSRINSVSGPSLPGESRSAGQAVGSFAARMTSEVCKDCNLISNHIVIGGRATAKDLGKLQDLGVTHILNVCQQLPNFHPSKFAYMKIDVLGEFRCQACNIAWCNICDGSR